MSVRETAELIKLTDLLRDIDRDKAITLLGQILAVAHAEGVKHGCEKMSTRMLDMLDRLTLSAGSTLQ